LKSSPAGPLQSHGRFPDSAPRREPHLLKQGDRAPENAGVLFLFKRTHGIK